LNTSLKAGSECKTQLARWHIIFQTEVSAVCKHFTAFAGKIAKFGAIQMYL